MLDHVREALTVPETMKADDLLREMRRRRTHQAIVIDEYGGTAGLVTFDGLMERIVGGVGDEFGATGAGIALLADGSALIDGLALVTDVNEQFGLHDRRGDLQHDRRVRPRTAGPACAARRSRRRRGAHAARRGARRASRVARAPVGAGQDRAGGRRRGETVALRPASGTGTSVRGGRYRIRSSRRPLAITSSDAPMSATTAIHSVATPATASARNTALRASENAMFALTLRTVARPRRRR